jgi:hypothetical protein
MVSSFVVSSFVVTPFAVTPVVVAPVVVTPFVVTSFLVIPFVVTSFVADSERPSSGFRGLAFQNLRRFRISINKIARSSSASAMPTTMRPIEVALILDGHC